MKADLVGSVELTNRRVVAIDGGTATGKGRLILELAALLRSKGIPVIHLSTGSLYRAVTYSCLGYTRQRVNGRRGMEESAIIRRSVELIHGLSEADCTRLASERHIEMHNGEVWLDGKPADEEQVLKSPGVGNAIPIVAAHVAVRAFVNRLTRLQVNEFDGYLMIDGRDTTHVIVPDAPLKLLLSVAPQIAAQRSKEHTVEEIVARDEADRRHTHGALRHPDNPGPGVRVVATDNHTPESVRNLVYGLMRRTFPDLPPL